MHVRQTPPLLEDPIATTSRRQRLRQCWASRFEIRNETRLEQKNHPFAPSFLLLSHSNTCSGRHIFCVLTVFSANRSPKEALSSLLLTRPLAEVASLPRIW